MYARLRRGLVLRYKEKYVMDISTIWNMVKVHSGIPASFRMMKLKAKKKENEKLKIVFLCQLGQVWGCVQSIYEAALADDMVDPFILALPEKWEQEDFDKNAYHYMKECGYEVIDGFDEKTGSFFDLKGMNPDYVFIPRPYDSYLPEQFQSKTLSKYTKVCYVCYGYTSEGNYMLKTCFSKYFVSNCYMVFAENESVRAYTEKQMPIAARLGLHKVIKTPFPRFDLLKEFKGAESPVWSHKREETNKRIIWTPRWTLEEKLGGTNFFNFKDFFFDFAEKNPDCDFSFRPHPLAFPNFVKVGAMTEDEVREYKNRCEEAPNIYLDSRKEYLDSFASGDILVSDMSGVVVDFAVTGKPVIFCSFKEVFNDSNKKLMEAYYVVENVTQLQETLEMLCRGEDPKKEMRLQVVKEILGDCDGGNGKKILDAMKQDYFGSFKEME